MVVLLADETVATAWGYLAARAHARGRPRSVSDSWIAACFIVNRMPLATFNTKVIADFVHHDAAVSS